MRFKELIIKLNKFLRRKIYPNPSRDDILQLISILKPLKTDKKLIRLGGESDGGYLVPDDLKGIKACFSPGVGNLSDFELDCAEVGMKIFMADASVYGPAIQDSRFHFTKKFLGNKTRGKYVTLDKWVKDSKMANSDDLLLQMDIEGHEFVVLNSTSEKVLEKFRIIVIEFHGLHFLSDPIYYYEATKAFKKLLKNHFCVHIHPNNCCGIRTVHEVEVPVVAEFTFIRKNRIKTFGKVESFPHPLDRDNVTNSSLVLPEVWYSGNE
ncbi:FkbM family methyltransferase [Salinimicrobium sp. MT39]|uniref:FkbM family methyltransferase n=1 Tax=Salinimicrobium profundisediminis TaxID=2994553 RepID=A0A9X3I113_9FLAO|nr:FkbM family methyltransferase [Salinimicrobium profundisediminis]MCX2837487.1 FkbM family methyltransferase [Salinimicrobium profundisediminis]